MASAKKAGRASKRVAEAAQASASEATLAHRIHALLHTVRVIGHFEDELCTLLHEAEHGGARSAGLQRELTALTARLPAEVYLADVAALQAVLPRLKRSSTSASPLKKKRAAAAGPAAAGKRKVMKSRVTGTQGKSVVKKSARKQAAVQRGARS